MAEGTKGHTGMSDVGRVGEGNLEDANVSNNGRRDGGDEKESGRDDEEGNADPVESASHGDEVVRVVEIDADGLYGRRGLNAHRYDLLVALSEGDNTDGRS